MKARKILILTLLLILTSTFASHNIIHPANAAPVFVVSLDAHSTSQTDILQQLSYPPNSTFRVSALVNATAANPISGVWAWQFAILYDPTILVPLADPTGITAYPDAAGPTAQLGALTTGCVPTGGCNWNGAVGLSPPGGASIVTIANPGEIVVGFTFLFSGHPNTVAINQRTILANVAFEIIRKPITKTTLALSQVSFVDMSGSTLPITVTPGAPPASTVLASDPKIKYENAMGAATWAPGDPVAYDSNNNGVRDTNEMLISGKPFGFENLLSDPNLKFVDTNGNGVWDPGEPIVYDSNANGVYDPGEPVVTGGAVTENILNDPPAASFTATQLAPYKYSFASTSTDGDGRITSYFWDFGDGTQDLNVSGSLILIHDYNATCNNGCLNNAPFPGIFDVTLRVVDDKGATGSARDANGIAIINLQPSHTDKTVLADRPPVATFTISPTNPSPGATIAFDSSASNDPDGTIILHAWSFGDGTTGGNVTSITHVFATAGTYNVQLNVTDNAGLKTSTTIAVTIAHQPPSITVTAPTSATSGTSTTVNLSAVASTGSISSIKVDWGDGTSASYSGTTTSVTHTYTNSGSYTITVTATDDSGSSTQKISTIAVSNAPPSGLSLTTILLIAVPIIAIVAIAFLLIRRRSRRPIATPGSSR